MTNTHLMINGGDNDKKTLTLQTPKDDLNSLAQPIPTLGHEFKKGREKLNLKVEDVASKLRVKVTVIESIENDCLQEQLPFAFFSGYLRSYAKILNLPQNKIDHFIKNTQPEDRPLLLLKSKETFYLRNRYQFKQILIYITLTLFIFFIIIWALFNYVTIFNKNRENFKANVSHLYPDSEQVAIDSRKSQQVKRNIDNYPITNKEQSLNKKVMNNLNNNYNEEKNKETIINNTVNQDSIKNSNSSPNKNNADNEEPQNHLTKDNEKRIIHSNNQNNYSKLIDPYDVS